MDETTALFASFASDDEDVDRAEAPDRGKLVSFDLLGRAKLVRRHLLESGSGIGIPVWNKVQITPFPVGTCP